MTELSSNNERACERIGSTIDDKDDNLTGVVRLLADVRHFCERNLIAWRDVEIKSGLLADADSEADDRAGWNGPRETYAPQLRGQS
jgi:hypothetical protein